MCSKFRRSDRHHFKSYLFKVLFLKMPRVQGHLISIFIIGLLLNTGDSQSFAQLLPEPQEPLPPRSIRAVENPANSRSAGKNLKSADHTIGDKVDQQQPSARQEAIVPKTIHNAKAQQGRIQNTALKFNFTDLESWESELRQKINNQQDYHDLLRVENIFSHLMKQGDDTADALAKKSLEQGRRHFSAKRFTEAIEAYNQVSRDSEFWLESLEEKGWAHFRKGEFNQALAQVKTLHAPQLVQVTDPESFYLSLLTRLKTCDYLGVIETIELLKNSQRNRFQEIEKLAQGERTAAFQQFVAIEKKIPLRKAQLGRLILTLPRLFHRDRKVQELALRLELTRHLENERFSVLARQSPSFSRFRQDLLRSKISTENQLFRRIQILAKESHESHLKLLQRVALFEVELLQRLYADRDSDVNRYLKNGEIQVSRNQITFPLDDRPWMDELGHIQTQLHICPQQRRKL